MRLLKLIPLLGMTLFPACAQDFSWSGDLRPGQKIEVRGINGAILARLAPGAAATVKGRKIGEPADAGRVRAEAVPHAGGLLVCAVYLSPEGEALNPCTLEEGKNQQIRRIDAGIAFTIEVPAGVALEAKTVNGKVDVEGLKSNVTAKTVNGSVGVTTSGRAQASTVNGSVRVTMGQTGFLDGAEFKTVNGSVELSVPSNLKADLEAGTVNGKIETDFPIEVNGKFGPRKMNGRINGGGRRLEMKTVNGSIRLKKTA